MNPAQINPAQINPSQSTADNEQLHLLSIFHYVLAGICALGALFPLLYFCMGLFMVSRSASSTTDAPGALFAGCFLLGVSSFVLLFASAYAVVLFLTARFIEQRRRHMFCVVVAAISCCFTPLGTVLGTFTLSVLFRATVKAQFGIAPAPPSPAPSS
ncbi:MAG: hypothetical protein ABI639_07875 [Thermoanaerobaculia bacterium]